MSDDGAYIPSGDTPLDPPRSSAYLAIAESHAVLDSVAQEAIDVLRLYLDNEDCRLDHHGLCQTHGLDNPCEQMRARAVVQRFDNLNNQNKEQ